MADKPGPMKALTICQPFAYLISLPDNHIDAKRVENRNWPTSYRGPLAIHAGKSKGWLGCWDPIPPGELVFGAVIVIADLVGCLPIEDVDGAWVAARWPWLAEHEHAEGPWCWVLENIRRIDPVYCSGKQKLWDWTPAQAINALPLLAAVTEKPHD